MGQEVKVNVNDGVAVVTINNPPVNALNAAVRQGLVAAFDDAEANDDVKAIVMFAEGRTFPAGADITEFGKPTVDPWLPEVCNRVEATSKPVVAAVHGTVLGGGFELALAAHYRIADPMTTFGLPEVTLGILPGAGGTQRVPRICGAEAALDLMIAKAPISAAKAVDLGLIDGVSRAHVRDAALDFARELIGKPNALRPTRERTEGLSDPVGYARAVAAKRQALAGNPLFAPAKIVDCVEAAMLLPFEGGLAFEQAAFEDCLRSDQSAALRHVFFAERKAAKAPEVARAKPRPVEIVGIVGGGTMGSGIAASFLDAGFPVVLVDRDQPMLDAAMARIKSVFDNAVQKGRITAEMCDERMARLTGDIHYFAVSEADLVIECVIEDMSVKEQVFATLDAVIKPGAILATNTSYLDINTLAAGVAHPENVLGLHFFSPAHVMRLVEVVVGKATEADVVATGFTLAKKLGKIPVRSGVADGFIGNSILAAYRTAADFMLEDGASPYQVDATMRAFGFPMGPYQVLDLAGLDISWARRKRLKSTRDPEMRYIAIGDKMCQKGWLGQKAGRGYYTYADGSHLGVEDPEVLGLIAAERERKGITPRAFGPEEILYRCLSAMVNEGANLVLDKIAQRPSDIDVAMIHGYGFPRWRGGPMKAAELSGLLSLRNQLREFAKEDKFWTPSPLFDEVIKAGHGFDTLNAV